MAEVSARLEARIRRDFERGSADEVLRELAELDLRPWRIWDSPDGRERIQAALVVPAHGKYPDFERRLALARVDWRDALVAAGLANGDWRQKLDEVLETPRPAQDGPRPT